MQLLRACLALSLAALSGCSYCKFNSDHGAARVLHKGDQGILRAAKGALVYVASDKSIPQHVEAALAKDQQVALAALVAAHQAYTVEAGTHARITAENYNERQVVILDGPQSGQTGWITWEMIHRTGPGER